MPGLLPNVDPDGLLEYSVVFTDRALNHMSRAFQRVMNDISRTLKHVYRAESAVVVPGSGTFGMEAVARQFATGRKCLVIRNGWFSYRWTQIFDMGSDPVGVDGAEGASNGSRAGTRRLRRRRSRRSSPRSARSGRIWCSRRTSRPHPESSCPTATCARSPTPCMRRAACSFSIASPRARCGSTWLSVGVDILISAPQKGWSSSACCALVMLSERARDARSTTRRARASRAICASGCRSWKPTRRAAMPTTRRCRPMRWPACATSMQETEAFGFAKAARRSRNSATGCAHACGQGDTERRAPRLPGAGRGRQLHGRPGRAVGQQIPGARAADRRRRAVAMRRARRLPHASASDCSASTSCATSIAP